MAKFENTPEQQLADLASRRTQLIEEIEMLYSRGRISLSYQGGTDSPQILVITAYELTVARYDREITALERQLGIENPRDPEPKPAYYEEEVD